MQITKLSQDYFGFVRQPAAASQPAAEQTQTKRSRPATVLPAERLVEGELLKNRNRRNSDPLDQILWRSSLSNNDAASDQQGPVTAQAAQRAINSYLDYAASPQASGAQPSVRVDYYV